MSGARDLLVGTAESLFASTLTKSIIDGVEEGRWPREVWDELAASGLPRALAPEDQGGAGLTLADAAAVLRVAGAHAAPVPLAETLLASRLMADRGLALADDEGPITLAVEDSDDEPSLHASGGRLALEGVLHGVPWARAATTILVTAASEDGPRLVAVPRQRCRIEEGSNLAGEPRDRVRLDGIEVVPDWVSGPHPSCAPAAVRLLGAFTRVALMSGALGEILTLSVDYARERVQFGRPIGRFQAIQQQLAVLAGEAAAGKAAADAAALALDQAVDASGHPVADEGSAPEPPSAVLAVAAAKARLGEAAGRGSKIAHQVHGAIGFTHEHELHHRTRRLWAWREEFGSEGYWSGLLGKRALEAGADGLWPLLSGVD